MRASACCATRYSLPFGSISAMREPPRTPRAISALDRATKLAFKDEKETGKSVAWLTDALYQLGSIRNVAYDLKGAKDAWLLWLARSPKPGAQLKEVQLLMQTTLKDL